MTESSNIRVGGPIGFHVHLCTIWPRMINPQRGNIGVGDNKLLLRAGGMRWRSWGKIDAQPKAGKGLLLDSGKNTTDIFRVIFPIGMLFNH